MTIYDGESGGKTILINWVSLLFFYENLHFPLFKTAYYSPSDTKNSSLHKIQNLVQVKAGFKAETLLR